VLVGVGEFAFEARVARGVGRVVAQVVAERQPGRPPSRVPLDHVEVVGAQLDARVAELPGTRALVMGLGACTQPIAFIAPAI
jgi:hypothetical protein